MPHDLTPLGGHHADAVQIPVSLVRLQIPGGEKRIHDLDVTLYLNPSTGAVSMSPGAGLLDFVPYAGLQVPQIEMSETDPLAPVEIEVANVTTPGSLGSDGEWFGIVAANAYRETPADVWQGNLILATGTAPQAATFQGVVHVFTGNLAHIDPNRQTAKLSLAPPDPFTMTFPRRRYSPPGFQNMATPGTKVVFGYTERTL